MNVICAVLSEPGPRNIAQCVSALMVVPATCPNGAEWLVMDNHGI
jgi:hypothetical protein